MTIAFIDLETTGTDPDRHHLWEIGLVLRYPDSIDQEYLWRVRPDLATADPTALKIGGYYTRCGVADHLVGTVSCERHPITEAKGISDDGADLAERLASKLNGATLAAANVGFDAAFLDRFLRANGQAPSWDYHLLEIESYAAGALGLEPPWKLNSLLDQAGIAVPAADRHTALGDARAVRDLYDAVRANGAVTR